MLRGPWGGLDDVVHAVSVSSIVVVLLSIAAYFHSDAVSPIHGSGLLLLLLVAARLSYGRGLSLPIAVALFITFDGFFTSVALGAMAPDESRRFVEFIMDGAEEAPIAPRYACFLLSMQVGIALALSPPPRKMQFLGLVGFLLGYGVVLPAVVAYLHGLPLGFALAINDLTWFVAPLWIPFLCAAAGRFAWRRHRVRPPARLEKVDRNLNAVPVAAARRAEVAAQMAAFGPHASAIAVPLASALVGSPLAPIASKLVGLDFNLEESDGCSDGSSDGWQSASASRSSAGDSEHLAQYESQVFGDV